MEETWAELAEQLPDERCWRSLQRVLAGVDTASVSWRFVRTPTFTSRAYVVLDSGQVISLPRYVTYGGGASGTVVHEKFRPGKLLSPGRQPSGHCTLTLMHDKRSYKTYVHQLVAWAFLGPQPAGYSIVHRDGDASNNHASNLSYEPLQRAAHRSNASVRSSAHQLTLTPALLERMRAVAGDRGPAAELVRDLLDQVPE